MPHSYIYSKPDAVYLLALEEKLTSYFKKSLLYNYIIQLFPLLFTFLILVPLAMQALQLTVPFLCTVFIVLMITKAWNMYIGCGVIVTKSIWLITRLICNALIIYMLFYSANVLILGGLLLLLAFCFYIRKTTYKTNTVGLHNRARRKWTYAFINLRASSPMYRN